MSILAFSFSPPTFSHVVALAAAGATPAADGAEAAAGAADDGPELALRTVLRSLDSTLRVLPVESLVMVTEPPDEGAEGVWATNEAAEVDEGTELVFDMTAGSLEAEEEIVAEEGTAEEGALESLTGEMVTLVESFLLDEGEDEPEPKSRPSSSSTLSKAESEEAEGFASFSSTDFSREPWPGSWLLLLLTVRLLRSMKSLGLRRTRLDSLGLGRAFLAFGCSSLDRLRAGKSLFTAGPASPMVLSLCGPMSTNFTLQVLVVDPLLSSTVSMLATFSRILSSFFSAENQNTP